MEKKRYIKAGVSLVAIIMTGVIIVSSISYYSPEALAKETLPGVETIIANNGSNNPYTILEVVPNKVDAALGYLIGGEEPVSNGDSLKDIPVMEERVNVMSGFSVSSNAYSGIFGEGSEAFPLNYSTYVEPGDASRTFHLRGRYEEDNSGKYVANFTQAQYSTVSDNTVPGTYYERYVEFSELSNIGERYRPVLSPIVSTGNTVTSAIGGDSILPGVPYKTAYKYEIATSWSGASWLSEADNPDLSAYVGDVVYIEDSSSYEYYGIIEQKEVTISSNNIPVNCIHTYDGKYIVFNEEDEYTSGEVEADSITTEQTSVNFNMRFVHLEKNIAGGGYYVSSVSPITTSEAYGYSFSAWYSQDNNGLYVRDSEDDMSYRLYEPADDSVLRYSWSSDYSYSIFDTMSYSGGFTNHEWFKKYVFDRTDDECASLVIDIKTITMEELNAYDLASVDLVYFAGGTYGTDIIANQAMDLFGKVVNDKLPVIFNRSTYNNSGSLANLNKLGKLLLQKDFSAVDFSALGSNWEKVSYWTSLSKTMTVADATVGLNYVRQSVYVFDDTTVKFVNNSFNKAFSATQIAYGFSSVKEEIEKENFYRGTANLERMDATISQAAAVRYIINYAAQRNVIKTEINVLEIQPCSIENTSTGRAYTNTELKKYNLKGVEKSVNSITTPEIINETSIANNWATQFKTTDGKGIEKIHLTHTYTGEFVGKIEDLNETYDLIYLGLDTSTMNTQITNEGKTNSIKTNNTIYNDEKMNGLIYSHVGDHMVLTDTTDKLRGLLNPLATLTEYTMTNYHKYRYSGNDITPDKLRDLKEYVDAGFPVIFADGFFLQNPSTGAFLVNASKIDNTSYMYEFAQYVLDRNYMGTRAFLNSAVKDSDEQGLKKNLKEGLNLSKLSVTTSKKPIEYVEGTANKYLAPVNGEYILDYEFYLKNDAAVSILDTKYDCKLFIDTSVDGRFSSAEEIEGLNIYEWINNTWNKVSQKEYTKADGITKSMKYELTAGHYYKVTRQVPTGYVGVLPWKMIFSQVDNELVRKSISGYTAVPIESTDRQPIKVLQIISGTDGHGKFSAGLTLDLKNNATVQGLFAQIKDFSIDIDTISASDYIKMDSSVPSVNSESDYADYTSYLNNYDMIIMGFTDGYIFDSGTANQMKAAALAIRKYIEEGRSVLFTHDTTSFVNLTSTEYVKYYSSNGRSNDTKFDDHWGYFFNRYIRDAVGMDRYGVMQQIATAEGFNVVDTVYDHAWIPDKLESTTRNSTINLLNTIQGYSNGTLLGQDSSSTKNNNYTYTSRHISNLSGQYGDNYVTEINEGQITKYPFAIPQRFKVSNTHWQYYQLNLETNSKDNILNDDIVVWYCISDSATATINDDAYRATPNDARNNYYIYNKGNVTYSGVGHSTVTSEMELKLFVNTMVAAYNAGVHPPRIVYKESENIAAATIDYVYMPYDSAIGLTGSFIDESADIYFDVSDTSFVNGTKTISAEYYVQVSATQGGTLTNVDGKSIYLKKLTDADIISMKNISNGTIIGTSDYHIISNDFRYVIELNTTLLNLSSNNLVNVYIGAKTTYNRNGEITTTSEGYYKIGVVRTQLFELE